MEPQSSTRTRLQDCAARAFGTSIGNLFLGGFGLLWIVISMVLGGKDDPFVFVALACVFGIFVVTSVQTIRRAHPLMPPPDAISRKIRKHFRIINIVQWVLIIGVAFALSAFGLYNWILPAIIFIIGLHFFPLIRLFHNRTYWVTAPAILAWAVVYPILFSPGKGDWIGGIGMGVILWLTAFYMLGQIPGLLRRINSAAQHGQPAPNGAHA